MPSVVKNQSQLRVPPMPWMMLPALSANGNFRPDLTTAVLLPAAGLPITMYQGNSYSAERPVVCPSLDVLMVLTASPMRERMASNSAWFLPGVNLRASSTSSSMAFSSALLARQARQRWKVQTSPQTSRITASAMPA